MGLLFHPPYPTPVTLPLPLPWGRERVFKLSRIQNPSVLGGPWNGLAQSIKKDPDILCPLDSSRGSVSWRAVLPCKAAERLGPRVCGQTLEDRDGIVINGPGDYLRRSERLGVGRNGARAPREGEVLVFFKCQNYNYKG